MYIYINWSSSVMILWVNRLHQSDWPRQSLLLWCCDAPLDQLQLPSSTGNSFRVQQLRKLRMSYGQFTTDVAVLTSCQQECGVFLNFCRPAFCYCYVMWQVVWQPPREAWQNSPKRVFLVLIQGRQCVCFTQLIWFVSLNSAPTHERILQWIPLVLF